MKRFILRVLLFCICFICFDRIFILLRNESPSREIDKRLETVINGKINADILIFGSSRGARDVIAEDIREQTNKTCFNLSYPGSDISFHEFLLAQVLKNKNKNKKPRIVILAVDDPAEFMPGVSIKFRFDRLYPLVKYETIRKTLVEKGEKNGILTDLFILHQLNQSNFDIRKKHFTALDTLLPDGSMPISFQKKGYVFNFDKNSEYSINKELKSKVEYFTHFIEMCKKNGIELIIVFPPNYGSPNLIFEKRIIDLSKGKQVHYVKYDTQETRFLDKNYFYDGGHLIKKGAEIFTSEIAQFIKSENLD